MSNIRQFRQGAQHLSWRPFFIAALACCGGLNAISAALAEGTTAGQIISNTATATYTDADDKILTTTSNTVEVTVAEVAGITITNTDIRNTLEADNSVGDGEFEPGDILVYEFAIKNVGNDATKFSLTDIVGIAGPIDDVVSVQYDSDGDGLVDTNITGRTEIQSVAVNEIVQVEITVKVANTALLGDVVGVTLGDTPGDSQNQAYDASANSIFTVDNNTAVPGEADPANPPVNGEREASATASIELGGLPIPKQPLVTLLKSAASITDTGVANNISDDTVRYILTAAMQDTAPVNSDVIAADLEPIAINLNGRIAQDHYILVSDAIPLGTVLATPPTAPAGWELVYSTTPVSTDSALSAAWQTGAIADLSGVTRIGFIYNPGGTSTAAAGNGAALSKTTADVSFTIDIQNTVVNVDNGIANIAQVFGAAQADDPGTPGIDESLNYPVIDESGDITPSNYNELTGTYGGVDPNNPNTDGTLPLGFTPGNGQVEALAALTPVDIDGGGATPGDFTDDHTGIPNNGVGEPVVVELGPLTTGAVANGPNGAIAAIGPTGTNDDFTNKATKGGPGIDPDSVGFTNTVANTGTAAGDIQLVLESASTTETDPTYLPPGTEVTMVLLNGTVASFVLNSGGQWENAVDNSPATFPVIQNLLPGQTQNYSIEVDLPNDSTTDLEEYPVVIDAQLDLDGNGFDDGSDKTIDRIYTGFLALTKTASIRQGDGPVVTGGSPVSGNHIVYTIGYTNISDAQIGSMTGNVVLTASNLDIFEDGTLGLCEADGTGANPSGLNNWAIDNQDEDSDGFYTTGIDTSHVPGLVDVVSGLDAGSSGTVKFYNGAVTCTGSTPDTFDYNTVVDIPETSGTTITSDVTRYLFEITGTIQPGETGAVEFRRRVN